MHGYLAVVTEGDPERLLTLPDDFILSWTSTKSGASLLHYAANHGLRPDTTVPFLVERGLSPNSLSARHQYPLAQILTRPPLLTVAWCHALLAAGASLELLPCGGLSLLANAVSRDIPVMVDVLVDAGVRRTHPTKRTPPLNCPDAVIMRRVGALAPPLGSHTRLAQRLPPTQEDKDRLLAIALGEGLWDWASHWQNEGANILHVFPQGNTALHLMARRAAHEKTIDQMDPYCQWVADLVAGGLSETTANEKGETPQQLWAGLETPVSRDVYRKIRHAISMGSARCLDHHAPAARLARSARL